MDDNFKVLMNEAVQLIHKGDLVNARIKYNSLISYQREKVSERPDSCENKAMLGCALSLVGSDDDMPANQKLTILEEAVSLFDEISRAPSFVLVPAMKASFCDVFEARGRIFLDSKNYEHGLKELKKAAVLYEELKKSLSGLPPPMWMKLAGISAMSGSAVFNNDRNALTADKALALLNYAITVGEDIKQNSPEVYESCQDLLPLWYKIRDGLNGFISTGHISETSMDFV